MNMFANSKMMLAVGLLCAAALVASGQNARNTQGPESNAAQTPRTTAQDRTLLSVTIYNSNVALVRDVREINLPAGETHLRFEDVAATLEPGSVSVESPGAPSRLAILQQNFFYDPLDPQKLLEKYVGREVTLVRDETENGTTKTVEIKALLFSDNNGQAIWKIDGEFVTGYVAEQYRFPELPENLYAKPTLEWTLENRGAGRERVATNYLAGNINWSADYILSLARDEKTARLEGRVTLANNSGATFRDAELQLVAGDVHRVAEAGRFEVYAKLQSAGAAAPTPFSQQNFSEYHLYALRGRTTLADKESKQIQLLEAASVPIEKSYVVEGQQFYAGAAPNRGNPTPVPVRVFYKFTNDEKSGLGIPIPAGIVRVYLIDSEGHPLLAGEDQIQHTAKDEPVSVEIGNAFDIVCERTQTDYQNFPNNIHEMAYRITLRNHKDLPVTVDVREPAGGAWEIISSTSPSKKLDAQTVGFEIPVAANGTANLEYRIRVRY